MKIKDLVSEGLQTLQNNGVPDADYDVWELLSFVTKKERLLLPLIKESEIDPDEAQFFLQLISKRSARFPLQYIEGYAWFMGFRFIVSPSVLIPRFDTEILCESVLNRLPNRAEVLDIGTGSGAIAVSIKKLRPDVSMTAVDISESALTVAAQNAKLNSADVSFMKSDCFSSLSDLKYDVIISNPPYISEIEMKTLMPEVHFEPENALYGGKDGLDFYRRISSEAVFHLKERGMLVFEIGWHEKDEVCAILRNYIGEPFCKKDLDGNWRVVGAVFDRK